MRLKDLDEILQIEQACFHKPWSKQSMEAVLTQKNYASLGAFSRERVLVGYIIYSEVVDELHILNIAIHPAFRRKGVGSFMLESVHQEAFDHGRKHAFLEVRESNSAAQRLYERHGYAKLTKRLNYYEDDQEDAILMGAKLKKLKT